MSVDRKSDQCKNLAPETPAKVAKVAKEDNAARTITLAGLAALAARSAEEADFSLRRIASSEHKTRNSDCRWAFSRTLPLIDIPADGRCGIFASLARKAPGFKRKQT
jgi:hypothetical protein